LAQDVYPVAISLSVAQRLLIRQLDPILFGPTIYPAADLGDLRRYHGWPERAKAVSLRRYTTSTP